MLSLKLTQGISPWHLKSHTTEIEEQELKIRKVIRTDRPPATHVRRSTPEALRLSNYNCASRLSVRKLSQVGPDIDRFERTERLHLPRTVSVKKPAQERKILEELTVKEFVMLGEKPAQIFRKKDTFRSSFMMKHKLRREIEKENSQKPK